MRLVFRRRLVVSLLLGSALASPVLAGPKQPLVIQNGQVAQIQSGDTLSPGSVPAIALGASGAGGVSGTLSVANGGTGATNAGANVVFAGPASGGGAAPAFRALTTADIPTATGGAAIPLLSGANTWGAAQIFPAPAGSSGSLALTPGNAPSAPANGAVWATSQGLFAQIGGSPLALGAGGAPASIGRLAKAVAPSSTVYAGGAATFASNAYTVAKNQQICPTALNKGQFVAFVVPSGGANTGAATLNFCALGAKAIKLVNSAGTVLALNGGEIAAGQPLVLTYDGSQYLLPWSGPTTSLTASPVTASLANFANGDLIGATGAITITLPCSAAVSPNGRLFVIAPGGAVTISRGASCSSDAVIKNGASAASQTLAQGSGQQVIVNNGAGSFYVSGS